MSTMSIIIVKEIAMMDATHPQEHHTELCLAFGFE
jgi:hypothetical protein